jgi:hypothetical protein
VPREAEYFLAMKKNRYEGDLPVGSDWRRSHPVIASESDATHRAAAEEAGLRHRSRSSQRRKTIQHP